MVARCVIQARQSRLECGMNVDAIDDMLTAFQTAEVSQPGFTDVFVKQLVSRLTTTPPAEFHRY